MLGAYLREQATDLLRGLRAHGETAGSAETAGEAADAVRRLRRSARRLDGVLRTYRPLVDSAWADRLRTELGWLSDTLTLEYAYAARLDRLLGALHRLASDGGAGGGAGGAGQGGGALPVGAARAGALLERQLTLARTRAHSAALQALGSSRFHAVADAVALLASEAPLTPEAGSRSAHEALVPLADRAYRRLVEAAGMLPLARAEHPYNAEALARSLTSDMQGDAAWVQVRLLLRTHRYAQEVLRGPGAGQGEPETRAAAAGRALGRHRDAAEAAAAAAAAARTPRIAPATAYALGVLHADQRHEVEAARFAFGRLWSAGRRGDEPGARGRGGF
ncbi:CHAD domain-containing protein [Streptomyces sp. JJ36]|uniref:CHAD domain-containing protein n=1 Tax=Streptomyces sp. JJ36 TaxID=2736645 RepID=UPI001F2F2181|nr:CHAD domain-containing protein [Streptomyces sp. JJ36]MCF6523812.1 CHAD domain-containing protein [Streptomyces sp. JJ36]